VISAAEKDEFFAWRRTNPVDETDDSPMIIPFWFTKLARSSSRLGHGPLKAEIRVRSPYALPAINGIDAIAVEPLEGGAPSAP
jgi:hypothetical protein